EAIAREVSKQLADDKKISKLEKDERILWKKSEVGDYEATAFSFFFNNALFHATFLVLSFFLLATLSPAINCVGSFVGASGLAALLSTSKLNSLLLPAGIPGPEGNKGICPKYCALDGGVFFEDGTYSFLL
uniref:Translocon-associated protein subunit gamma n=1 Tax=Panagrolaimus sp. PS1159 TaxID=55785 RepID=A0AC35GIN6_9BILA